MYTCPACGGTDVQTDPFSNDVICATPPCFALIEENRIVAEIGFTENRDGTVSAAGQKVSWEQNNGFAKGEPRELTISKGSRILETIANGLNLKTNLIDQGRRIFLLAVQRNFTKGRQTKLVCAACLYIVCRRDRSPHLLVDFSDVLQVSVKHIGQVYMKLVRLLNFDNVVDVPLIDPSLFMERFATKLELPSNQAVHEVTQTAIRFVQAMNRDWICTGRRPTGLCGAALLLSSRYHGHRILASDISNVVRMGECTLKRRLFELRQTPLALMDRQEFERTDFTKPTQECFPPAMLNNVQRELQAIEGAKAKAALLDNQKKAESESLPALEDVKAGEAPATTLDLAPPTPSSSSAAPCAPITPNRTPNNERKRESPSSSSAAPSPEHPFLRADSQNLESIVDQIESTLKSDNRPKSEFFARDKSAVKEGIDPMDPLFEDLPFVDHVVAEDHVVAPDGDAEGPWETLSDIDSEDIDLGSILTEEEQVAKREIWNEVNKECLEEMHLRERQKRKKKLENEAEGKRRRGADKVPQKANSVVAASRLVLDSRARSIFRQMPDNVLEQLFS